MPRKRTISDEALLDAAMAIVHERGPAALTFQALAGEVDLAPSTIVQRFGTKAGLLRAALLRAWDHLDADTASAIDRAGPGRAGVVDLLVAVGGQYHEDDYAEQLVVLREDLRDPVLRARGTAWIGALAEAVEQRLADAPGGPAGLGELVVAHWQGTLTVWGFTRPASVDVTTRRFLDALLDRLLADHDA